MTALDPATLRALAADLDALCDREATHARSCGCGALFVHAARMAVYAEMAADYRTRAIRAEQREATRG